MGGGEDGGGAGGDGGEDGGGGRLGGFPVIKQEGRVCKLGRPLATAVKAVLGGADVRNSFHFNLLAGRYAILRFCARGKEWISGATFRWYEAVIGWINVHIGISQDNRLGKKV